MVENVISVSNLEKSYKNVDVLKKISFSVQKGSIFALLGSNGAGKTTTIRILATLLKPDGGDAQICGADVATQGNDVRAAISLTGQSAAVDDILTGRENLRLIAKLRHLADANKIADELLERFGLTDAADRALSTYSGGMRRRLDLAMSLIGNPAVIFLDEPTTGLDPQSRMAMWKIIRELAGGGTTVFLTTQYLEEAEQLADQIAILNEGKIVADGTVEELKKMLPSGHLELRFADVADIERASEVLKTYEPSVEIEIQAVLVKIDGTVKQMVAILSELESANIPVLEFSQKSPTLEDVFLTIINYRKEGL
ncbi:daunorubicin resistance protein DrrA family ABC transporter ATP-binding protein [Paenilisteria rocourtiae]|uniref:ABC-2 type transport system ATP-binding protein n=1 Tax=Listeria rocourtiae TaxID=647910 RepID=A0A4R6ZLC6_9LIST|nr:daunorubicin resistance protein DrrA family ABC transporter ATP-binding protein [Listeria rocourtiae]EUJ43625.1 multidrug ABC transporter ATPase [Listeria rocourtiae FSL F6-920]MBC1434890.1 daunorubicin resistance protein DrrA family ABC transporter ATP-binding protein [Listeria rocourtiae]MBC1605978.1 daunorubicin resistance protein DrrA family ABC transporter ATP-binding protein [Listeria rocourtiae]TDR53203.1 ABC-2 type transport system ATP-binding protein [Listeria rocourtiae]